MRRNLRHYIAVIISLTLFGVALFIIHHKLSHYRYRDIAGQLAQMPRTHLLAAIVLMILDYLVLTAYDFMALRYIQHPIKYSKTAFASFMGYAFSHNMTILGGSAVRYRIYSMLGVSAGKVAALVAFCSLTFWLGFLSVGSVVFLFSSERVPDMLHLPFASARPIGAIFLVIVTAYVTLAIARRTPVRIRGWEFVMPSPTLVGSQIITASIDWLLAGSVLFVLLPGNDQLDYIGFMPVFMLAQIAGLLSYVPGGLGVFETAIILLLSPFYEPSAIVSSLLVYRFVYYLIPFGVASLLLAGLEFLLSRHLITRLASGLGRAIAAIMPNILAVTTFISGVVLLFSGALPATRGRMAWLRDLLPLPAIEFSHFLASLTGAGLLILARAIHRKVDIAYHLTAALLMSGVVLSLLKGLDYEEAIALLVMLLILLPCRASFYRKSSILAGRLTSGWVILAVVAVLCSVWLGIFSYKYEEYSHNLWWLFATDADAPRFLRGSAGAVSIILLFAIARLIRGSAHPQQATLMECKEDIGKILAASPKTSAHLALLGDKQFVFNDERNSFIMFAIEGRSWVAMGDPVGPEEEWDDLLWSFREMCDEHDAWPVFYQIDQANLPLYLQFGMRFLKLGEEAKVDLGTFSLEGGEHKGLRYSHNKLTKEGYAFEIVPAQGVDAIMPALRNISDGWLESKHTREKKFSLGFFEPEYIRRTPVAVVRKNEQIIAFANVWEGADKYELSIDLMRHLPLAQDGIMDYLFAELMLWGKKEGFKWFNLGMVPMSGLEDSSLAPLWERTGAFLFRHGEHFYNFQGLRQYKEKFNPVWEPKYLATRGGLALPQVLANVASLISGGPKGVVTK
ncbi:MAG: bifunctional lysylphosphatidylglycerol flippase/synthetase MprF [Sedimentisphaerales bacterium]